MNLQVTKRLDHGLTGQVAYTWSRTLGQTNGGAQGPDDGNVAYLNPRDRSRDKGLVSYHRTHDIRSNGTFELPFGQNRRFLSNAPGVLARLVERWQLGGIFSWTSGAPLTITASGSTFTWASASILGSTPNTPVILGDFPKSTGKVTPVANGATYFSGFQQVSDPMRNGVTTLQGLQNQFSKRAIADAQGNLILVNPVPGQLGNLGNRWIEGPSRLGLDLNLVKRVRIGETKELEFRLDAVNILNTPRWNDPVTDINSLNFGRVTATDTSGTSFKDFASGNRKFAVNARVNF
jgi:hypothetical protein